LSDARDLANKVVDLLMQVSKHLLIDIAVKVLVDELDAGLVKLVDDGEQTLAFELAFKRLRESSANLLYFARAVTEVNVEAAHFCGECCLLLNEINFRPDLNGASKVKAQVAQFKLNLRVLLSESQAGVLG
jgi:hypothetical protein